MMNQEKLDYWKPLIARWRESKKARSVFCEENGLNSHTMSYWQAKLEKPQASKGKFIGIEVSPVIEVYVGDEIKISFPLGVGFDQVSECVRQLR